MSTKYKIDKLDLRILDTLQLNARITNQQLANSVNLSASACLSRVRKLEESGYLNRYIAEVNLEQLSPSIEAFAEITLKNHSQADFERFDQAINNIPEVISSFKISGHFDYLIRIICSNMKVFRELTDDMINQDYGIEKFSSLLVLEQTKHFSGLPIDKLLQDL